MKKALLAMTLLCSFFAGCYTASVTTPQALAAPAPVQYSRCTGLVVQGSFGSLSPVAVPQGWTVVGGGATNGAGIVFICS